MMKETTKNSQTFYTRTTGIWQTVWIEPVSSAHIERVDITPDVEESAFNITIPLTEPARGCRLVARVSDQQEKHELTITTKVLGVDPRSLVLVSR